MVNKVRTFIEQEALLPSPTRERAEAKLFVAISGGADSTALLLVMKELGYGVRALHCNFHLRGEESNRDQAFVEGLCRQHNVPLTVRHFNTEDYATRHGISIEMAARDLRYNWFREESKGEPLAVAHHRDDQAETLLLNLIRGTGLRGLAGMMPKHDGIVRPFLCLSREEILQYLESRGQTYVTDSTNSERACLRNRIRLDIIPLLRDINPSAVEHFCLACDNVRQNLPYHQKGIETAFRELCITEDCFPLSDSQHFPPQPLLHEWLAGKGFNRTQKEEMLKAEESSVGKMWHSSTHVVLRDRKALKQFDIHRLSPQAQTEQIPEMKIAPQLRQEIVDNISETGAGIAYFDADLLKEPIEVRRVRQGDAFVPFGMKGRKLVSDYLTDRKVNRLEKVETFVATCGGDIVWLIGHRSDNRYRVTDKTTRILKLSLANNNLK